MIQYQPLEDFLNLFDLGDMPNDALDDPSGNAENGTDDDVNNIYLQTPRPLTSDQFKLNSRNMIEKTDHRMEEVD